MAFTFKKTTSIGNLEAETDFFLENCFIETDAYRSLLTFEKGGGFFKRIIVGRTGSGKTALIKHLNVESTLYKNESIEAEKTIFEYVRNNIFITKLIQDKIDLRIFFKALWVHVILIKIIEIDIGKTTFLENLLHKQDKKDLREYIESYDGNFFDDEALTIITKRFKDSVEAELDTLPASISAKSIDETEKRTQSITNNYVNRELLSKQKKIITYFQSEYNVSNKQKKIIINIDDLDKSWLLTRNIKYDFINALLDAFKEFLDLKTIKIIVSIRTDILEGVYQNNLRQDEKDKSLIIPIEWSKSEIIELLDSRLIALLEDKFQKKKLPKFKDIFDFKVKNMPAYDFILHRTMLRPRDAIEFVNCCFQAADGETELREEHVLAAEETYFTSRKKALVKEWQSIYPAIQAYVDLIQIIEKQEFTKSTIKALIKTIKQTLLETCNEQDSLICKLFEERCSEESLLDEILDIWFTIGIIGIVKAENVVIYSKYEKEHLDISDYDKTFKIHDLYWRRNS